MADWPWPEWTEVRLRHAIGAAIATKDEKLVGAAAGYDELYLAMATDEPDIEVEKAAQAVAALELQAMNIDRAFLLLGYNPGVDKGTFPGWVSGVRGPPVEESAGGTLGGHLGADGGSLSRAEAPARRWRGMEQNAGYRVEHKPEKYIAIRVDEGRRRAPKPAST